VPPSQWRTRLKQHDKRICAEWRRVERTSRQRRLGEREIELASDERSKQCSGVRRLVERDRCAVDTQERRHEPGEQIWGGADAERRGAVAVERCEVGLRRAHPRDHSVGMTEQDLARFGERERPSPARALDQALPREVLKTRNLMADRRLDVAEVRGGAAKRPFARHGIERDEMPKLDAGPPFACHNRM
jgi:hypothetical protein